MSISKKFVSVILAIVVFLGLVSVVSTIDVKTASAASGPYTITIKYVDDRGNAIANDDKITTQSNGKYSIPLTTITGYTIDDYSMPLAGTLTEDATITMIYKPIEIQIKVAFVDEEGLPIKNAGSKTFTITIHDYLLLDLRELFKIDGYRYVDDQEIIAVAAVGTVNLRLTYVKDDGAREGGCSLSFGGNNMVALFVGLGILTIAHTLVLLRKKKLRGY